MPLAAVDKISKETLTSLRYKHPAFSINNSKMILSSLGPRSSSGCCESGRPVFTDPTTGQSICSCQYLPGLIGSPTRNSQSMTDSLISSAYAAHGYLSLGTDAATLCAALGSRYDLKDNPEALRSLAYSSGYYSYDPNITSYPYSYSGLDLNSAARRKNATRENTNTLKAWLYEHRKNPYPTKGEKIMLAIITKMTLTQVSTWFANARRRLKKENKMTWSPRPGLKHDDDDDDDDDELLNESRDSNEDDKMDNIDYNVNIEDDEEHIIVDEGRMSPFEASSQEDDGNSDKNSKSELEKEPNSPSPIDCSLIEVSSMPQVETSDSNASEKNEPYPVSLSRKDNFNELRDNKDISEEKDNDKHLKDRNESPVKKKPKIWSLADTATSQSTTSKPTNSMHSRTDDLTDPRGFFSHYSSSYPGDIRSWFNNYNMNAPQFYIPPHLYPRSDNSSHLINAMNINYSNLNNNNNANILSTMSPKHILSSPSSIKSELHNQRYTPTMNCKDDNLILRPTAVHKIPSPNLSYPNIPSSTSVGGARHSPSPERHHNSNELLQDHKHPSSSSSFSRMRSPSSSSSSLSTSPFLRQNNNISNVKSLAMNISKFQHSASESVND